MAAGLQAVGPAATADAGPVCAQLQLVAELDARRGEVRGHMACQVAADGEVALALYPGVLADAARLDDLSGPLRYPEGFSAASMRVWLRPADGAAVGLAAPDVWAGLGRRRAGEWVNLDFVTQIPRRNGVLGRQGEVFSLLGGWHPALGRAGALPVHAIDYHLTLPPDMVGLAGARPVGRPAPGARATARGCWRGRLVPWLAAPAARVEPMTEGVVVAASGRRPTPLAAAFEELGELDASMAVAAAFARNLGVAAPPLIVVVGRLREHLIETFEGGMMVSDRIFALLGGDMLRAFHRASLWRAQYAAYALAVARRRETRLPPEVAADAAGAGLGHALARAAFGGSGGARRMLERVAVVPAVDQLLFAPQLAFADSYFDTVDDAAARRTSLAHFAHPLPRGRALFERLVDHVGAPAAEAWAADYLVSGGDKDLLGDVAARFGAPVGRAVRRALGPVPRISLALTDVVADAGGDVVAEVDISGPDAAAWTTPVTLECKSRDRGDLRQQVVPPARARFVAAGAADHVEVDPDGRIHEMAAPPGRTPRYDNRRPHRWRLLLNDISGTLSATQGALQAAAEVSLRRIDDLRFGLGASLQLGPGSMGGGLSGALNLGPKLTDLRRTMTLGGQLVASRLRPEAVAPSGGQQVGLQTRFSHDTRLWRISAFRGSAAEVDVSQFAAELAGGRWMPHGRLGGAALYLWPLGLGQAWLTRLRADWLWGAPPLQSQLRLGSRYQGARGFDIDEERGTRRLIISQEWRHTLAGQARHNLLGLAMLTRLEAAAFADAVYLPVRRPGCGRDWFLDVGYGLRVHADVVNIAPATLQLDIGVPLSRCPDQLAGRPPVTVWLAFIQSFWSF